MPEQAHALQVRGLSKSFGHLDALAAVDLDAAGGEILAIVGDNGAGKSTLVNLLIGLYRPSAGTIEIGGRLHAFRNPAEAAAAGIAAVTQDLALVECLDVATNMFLGQALRRLGFVDRRAMAREARTFLDGVGATVSDVRTPIGMLSGGQRQMVAIARALRLGAPLVLMDEPTAALGVRETGQVAELVRRLRERGKAVIIVSHDLGFVFDVADRIQVLRLGHGVAVLDVKRTDRAEVVGLITGAVAPKVSADA